MAAFSVRYALWQYVTVAVVIRCVLCEARNRRSNMKTLCSITTNCTSVLQTIVDVFMSYSECDVMLSRPITGPHLILT